jgi:hypothetical protein
MPQVQFRCWFCNRRYTVSDLRVGERIVCNCERTVRVPKQSGGNSRAKTLLDWIVEAIVYGGGGALLGLGLALLILALFRVRAAVVLLAVFPVIGLLIGLFGGERGINWIGRHIRDIEDNN